MGRVRATVKNGEGELLVSFIKLVSGMVRRQERATRLEAHLRVVAILERQVKEQVEDPKRGSRLESPQSRKFGHVWTCGTYLSWPASPAQRSSSCPHPIPSQRPYYITMPAQFGPLRVRFSFTDRSSLTILFVSSARSSVRPDPLHLAPVESLSPH